MYTPIGTAPISIVYQYSEHMTPVPKEYIQAAQRSIINGGKPSVSFRRQLYHICGINWMHQKTVPMVPRTLEATVTLPPPSDMVLGENGIHST